MAKRNYRCQCGWTIRRGDQTRRQYAAEKKNHATNCEFLKEELQKSAAVLGAGATKKA
jgi:hypothetical protein